MVKMYYVLVSTISNSQVFLLKKCEYFCKCKSYSHFFSKNISVFSIFNDQSFNDTLTNYIVSFEQLGPDIYDIRVSSNFYEVEHFNFMFVFLYTKPLLKRFTLKGKT